MCNCSLISRKLLSAVNLFIIALTTMGCSAPRTSVITSKDGYVITVKKENAQQTEKWANYLYRHLQKRANSSDLVSLDEGDGHLYELNISLDNKLTSDFKIENFTSTTKIYAKDERTMLWLIYQLMKAIGNNDERVSTEDLPPSIISFEDTVASFPFEYREAYFSQNYEPDYAPIIGANDINNDWGLWGHNLKKMIGTNIPQSCYATVDGKKYTDQYCFSSPELYKLIENAIIDGYGNGNSKGYNFAILPNDDECACTCASCKALGNTATNASPAVNNLIRRLATRFPKHKFFTSAYLSTDIVEYDKLPRNVGVIISAIDWQLRAMNVNKGNDKIDKKINDWLGVTDRVYIWDYASNYDDYFSPFPSLKLMKERIIYYASKGVKGLFLNGSGEDYSSFGDMQHFVLTSLMMNPELDVDALVKQYLNQYYPSCVELISNYYLSLEDAAVARGKQLNKYGGIVDEKISYLDEPSFLKFYDTLSKSISKVTDVEERKRLNQLFTSLTYTKLELSRLAATGNGGCKIVKGDIVVEKPEISEDVETLRYCTSFKNMRKYRESNGKIDDFIDNWHDYISPSTKLSLLHGKKLKNITELDEGYDNLNVLTDGVSGIPSDYHKGWLISTIGNLELELPIEAVRKAKTLNMSFLVYPHFHIFAPSRVDILSGGKVVKTVLVSPQNVSEDEPYTKINVSSSIDLSDASKLSIRIYHQEGKRKNLALDEIEMY